jgi:hypothetical protein
MGFMGLFSRNRRKQKDNREAIPGEEIYDRKEIKKEGRRVIGRNTQTDRISYIKENCESIMESDRQMEEAKVEYQAVTSYLTDMQKIDLIPMEQRDNLEDAARKIINLTRERSKLQQKSANITDRQYRLFERYEQQLPKEMPSMKESERRQAIIQQDIEHLERERQALAEEQEDIISKQAFLKGISITTSVIVILLFGIFALISSYTESNLTLPFLLTVLMAMASALYIFMEARKNIAGIKLVQLKQNRQIMLMNKVTIKSVNNRNYLEYTYSKYMVENYEQLKTLWEEFMKAKDEARRYQSNTELLEFYHKQLINELKKFKIADSEIWIYQPSAIIDNKEMVEVRHRLNVRRQKLRERIDMNSKQKEEALEAINSTITAYPDCKEEAEKIMRRYRIEQGE